MESLIFRNTPNVCATLLLAFATLATILFANLHWNKVVRKVRRFPGPQPLPIIGNALQLINQTTLLQTLIAWKLKYGPRVGCFFGYSVPVILIASPEDAELILTSPHQLDKADLYYPARHVFGDALLTAPGAKWRNLRKIVAPSFHFPALKEFLRIQNDYASNFSQSLDPLAALGKYNNILPMAAACTARTIIHTTFGATAESFGIETMDIVHATDNIARNWSRRILNPLYKSETLWKLSSRTNELQVFRRFTAKVMQTRKQEFSAGKLETLKNAFDKGDNGDDDGVNSYKGKVNFLDNLLLQQAEGVEMITDQEIHFNLSTIFAAGYDTSALTTSWLLYNLGRNLEIQAAVHQELDEIFADDPLRHVTTDDLTRLKFLEACIKETLRMFPTLPFVARKITADFKLSDGSVVPEGSNVMIHIFGIHRDPEIYPDPLVFDPERFLPENETKRHRFAFIPFSAGPRNCIGMRYAWFQMKTLAVHILRKYSVAAETPFADLTLAPDILLMPENGINIAFSNRHAK